MSSRIRDRLERLANPMLVRQMYQSLHSRKFLGAMWLLLLAALMTYVVIFVGSDTGSPAGGSMFMVFGGLFYLVALLVFPYMAFSSLRKEVKTKTIELIQITPLNAQRQIRGRLQAALSRLLLLYSVIGPFAVVAFLFGGISLWAILLSLYTLFIASCISVSVALFFASLASIKFLGPIARGIYLLLLVAVLIMGFSVTFGGSWFLMREVGRAGWEGILAYLIVLTLEGGLIAWFLCAASANILTFEANKSAGRMKFIMLLLVLSGLTSFGVIWGLVGGDGEVLAVIECFVCIALGVSAIFWLTGKRRVAAHRAEKLKHRSGWYRSLFYPFTDGAGATTAFLGLAIVVLATGIAFWCAFEDITLSDDVGGFFTIMALVYAPYFSSSAWIIGRFFPAKYRTGAVRRLIVLGFAVAHLFIAILWFASDMYSYSHAAEQAASPLLGLFPFIYMPTAIDRIELGMSLVGGLSVAITIGLVPHLIVGVRDLVAFCRASDLRQQYCDTELDKV